jgi:DUF971 family protein
MTVLPERVENHAARGLLILYWQSRETSRFTHAQLRAACPCSECRARKRAGESIESDEQIRLAAIEPVGLYALNLAFTDGHRRGIYPFQMLGGLG